MCLCRCVQGEVPLYYIASYYLGFKKVVREDGESVEESPELLQAIKTLINACKQREVMTSHLHLDSPP